MGDLSLYIGRPGMGSRIESAVADCQVVVTETTTAGVNYLTTAETTPDCIVTDHHPPEQDCFSLLDAVSAELPVVVVPTDGSSTLATRALRAGAATYLDPAAVDDEVAAIAAEIERLADSHRQRADDRIERFASLVSHELRSPIQKANSGIDLAKADCDSDYLDKVGETLDQMDQLVENLLEELEDGESEIETEAVDLSAVVDGVWPTQTTAALTIESELPTVDAETSRVRQLLDNLFRNSVQHCATGSRTASDDGEEAISVRIGVLDSPDGAGTTGIYIADDGPGIEPDRREDIFEYGYTDSENGTGFGLAIVKEIAEAFEWEINVTDSDTGGARFEIQNMKEI